MLSAIEIINSVTAELGLPTVTTSRAGPDDLGPQLLSLLNALCEELITKNDWQFLLRQEDFTQTDPPLQRFPVPEDFARQVNQTQWDTNNRQRLDGPLSPKQWGWVEYGLVGTGFNYRYRFVGNELEFNPVLGEGETVSFYYISKNCIQDDADPTIYRARIENEGDKPLFDSRVLIAGLKVKLWSIKGLDTTSLQTEASDLLQSYMAQNAGAQEINLSGGSGFRLIGMDNVPEGTSYGR
jgi:hypothetical protein